MEKEKTMKNVLSFFGAIFLIAGLVGSLLPGMSFQVFLGTKEGAAKWHEEVVEINKRQEGAKWKSK